MSSLLESARGKGDAAGVAAAPFFSRAGCTGSCWGCRKTLHSTLAYLPFGQAMRLPVFVSHRVWLRDLSGEVSLADPGPARQDRFGTWAYSISIRSRTIWQVSGKVAFMVRRHRPRSKIAVPGSWWSEPVDDRGGELHRRAGQHQRLALTC